MACKKLFPIAAILWAGLLTGCSHVDNSRMQIPWQGTSTLCRSPGGKICQILLDGGNIKYREQKAGDRFREEPVLIAGKPLHGEQPMLLFDAQGRPNIVDGSAMPDSHDWIAWYRKSAKGWEKVADSETDAAVKSPTAITLPGPINRRTGLRTNWNGYVPSPDLLDRPAHYLWSSVAAAFAPDGSLRILYCDEPGNGTIPAPKDTPFHLHLGSNAGDGTWRWTIAETFQRDWCPFIYYIAPRYFSFVVDRQGFNHILYSRGFGDTWPVRLRHIHSELFYVSDRSGKWTSELVSAPLDDSADAAKGASLAVDADGNVAVASCYVDRTATGSPCYANLVYHRRQADGKWTREVIASTADGYEAKDPRKGTGYYPYLVFDKNNLPHIVFCDFATQHWKKWHCMDYCGQIRHAHYDGNCWTIRTLFRQTDPLRNQIRFPIAAISDEELFFAAMQRTSVIDSQGSNVSVTDRYIEGCVALPLAPVPATAPGW